MFGRLPHELERLTPYELGLARLVARRWDEHVAGLIERSGGRVFPVVNLGG